MFVMLIDDHMVRSHDRLAGEERVGACPYGRCLLYGTRHPHAPRRPEPQLHLLHLPYAHWYE